MSALWLLPVITLVVASSGGGELAQALISHTTTGALMTLASAACTLSVGLGLASAILVVYLCRLILYGFPAGGAGVLPACVPLGPMGQAGVAALLLGEGARTLLPVTGSHSPFLSSTHAGESVYAICVCAALALWALATMWMGYAMLGVQYNVRRMGVPPFQLAYWGLIFPNVIRFSFFLTDARHLLSSHQQGVYANLTISLVQVLDASFFRVWGAVYAVFTLLLWSVVFYKTAILVPNGLIFDAPCLQEVDGTAMASSSSSSQTTHTEQEQEQEQDRERAEAPTPRQEKTSASIC